MGLINPLKVEGYSEAVIATVRHFEIVMLVEIVLSQRGILVSKSS